MANIIKPKRSNTAAKVPTTTELISGELGVNMADRKVYINNGTDVVQVGAGNLSGLGDVAIATPANGQALTYNSTTSKWENTTPAGSGTVTSVGITAGTGVTVSNSPITTSGNIAVGLSTKLTAIENLSGAGFITQNGSGAIAGRTLQAGTGISIQHGNGSSQDPVITNSAPDQTVALTGAGATTISGTYPNFTITSVNTTYGAATSTVPGLIELASDTAQTVAANAITTTASRTYGLQLNAAGQGVVNVPWTDTVYSLPAATSTVRGGIELGSDTAQTVASNAVTTTASRSYALQVNAAGQGVVNVPWTDTNSGGTVTSVTGGTYLTGGTITTSGTLAVDATSSNTASKVVARDASGNFSAGLITSYGRQENYGVPTDAGTVAGIMGGTSNGTIAAPTQTTIGQDLYKISGLGYTGSAWTGGAAIKFVATDNFTSTTRGTNVVLTAIAAGGAGGTNLTWNGSTLNANGTTLTGNTGTVTSVSGTGTVSGLSLSGTVTASGNLTLGGTLAVTPSNFASQTANTVLAAPNGAAGVPTFRAIVAADIPTLNQNTTGTAANVTGTVAVANGGTGATTAATARTNLGATTLGGNLYTLANVAAISFPRFNADNTVSSLDAASFRTAIGAGTSSTTGTVTSVGGTGTVSGLTLTGTVTTSGNLTLGGTLAVTPSNFASQTANTFLAAPSAAAGVPTFRTIVASDIPTLNQNTTGSAATLTTGRTIAMTGDVSYTSGSFNGSANVTGTATLANSGVTAGTYTKVTVNAKGLATSGTTLAASDIPDLTMAKLPGAAYKESVRCATTANITLSGTQTIDGIAVVAGNRVLVKNQTTASQNGIYVVSAGAWTRSLDADNSSEIGAAVVNVDSGTASGGELWTTTFKTTDTLGTTAMNWYEVLYNTGSWGISITGSSASTTGNAATATALQTARTIGGVSFNGTANINLPGVNTAGNQNTTGTAANVTGTVAVANGGTGSTTAAGALTNLGAYAATNPSGYITTAGARSAVSFTAGSGAYNSTTGVFTIPTNTNQLTNGAGFVTSSGVTSVSGTGTVSGLTLTGTVTSTGSLTLGGNLSIAADMIYNSFTATAAQTTFTTTNTYTSGKIEVFVNGVKMVNGSDVTVTSGTSVVMASGLPVGTRVDLVYPI